MTSSSDPTVSNDPIHINDPISSTASNDPNGSNDPIVVNTLNIKQAIHRRFHGAGSRAGNNDHDR